MSRMSFFLVLSLTLAKSSTGSGPHQASKSDNEIDTFMEKVLEKREINWDLLYNYVFREREVLKFESSIRTAPLQGFEREYIWYVDDGYLVRSPLSVNGVKVSEEERAKEERKWRDKLEQENKRGRGVSRDVFFGFDFEPGNYYFAGRREFEGREVVIVEYYPEKMFHDDDEDEDSEDEHNQDEPEDEEDELEDEIEAKLEKVFLVTLLIDPTDHQIVQMTLDNVGFDFLPAKWLVRIGTIEASMTMHQPFDDIWLVHDISAYGSVMTAGGSLAVKFTKEFYDYAIAETKVKYRFAPLGTEQKIPKKP